ncbi:MAG: hypothetical protein KGO81_08170 [Bacteroidota bacterium]|nr:hypothetical protein [Bacteroidota bacterium]
MKEELLYLLTTKYVDNHKWESDSRKGLELLAVLKKNLLPKFQLLHHYEDQIDFWENELGVNYFQYWLEYSENNTLIDLSDFELSAEKKDIPELHKWLLKQLPDFIVKIGKEKIKDEYGYFVYKRIESKLVSFDKLKNIYLDEPFSSVTKKKIDEVKLKFVQYEKQRMLPHVLPSDFHLYETFVNEKIELDFSNVYPNILNTISVHNAYNFALFRLFLNGDIKNADTNKEEASRNIKKQLSPSEIIVALEVSGVLELLQNRDTTDRDIAKFLSILTGNGEQGLREALIDHKKPMIGDRKIKRIRDLTSIKKILKEKQFKNEKWYTKIDIEIK